MTRVGVPALLLLLAGCSPQLEPIRWQGVDIDALREAIANPTGVVDETSANEVADEIVISADAYQAVSSYLHDVFLTEPGEHLAPAWVLPQALDGTSIYLLVACPGDGDAPPFSAGSIRIDSPTLTAEVVSTFDVRGQLLLSFEGCEIGPATFDGSSRVYRDLELGEFAVEPDIDVAFEDQTITLDRPILWDVGGEVHVLYELDSGDTLVLEWASAELELRLRGVNGSLVCTAGLDELECMAP
jgi:hypothetical protein